MTKTLYDPEVEKRGIKKGIENGIEQAIEKMLIKGMESEMISNILDVDINLVLKIKKTLSN